MNIASECMAPFQDMYFTPGFKERETGKVAVRVVFIRHSKNTTAHSGSTAFKSTF